MDTRQQQIPVPASVVWVQDGTLQQQEGTGDTKNLNHWLMSVKKGAALLLLVTVLNADQF